MATNNLVGTNGFGTAFSSGEERANSGPVPCEVVALACGKIPLLSFLNLNEAIVLELLLAVVNCVEVRRRSV